MMHSPDRFGPVVSAVTTTSILIRRKMSTLDDIPRSYGDATLSHSREDIIESYYNLHVWRGLFYALGFSFIDHPGCSKDRGPLVVPSQTQLS